MGEESSEDASREAKIEVNTSFSVLQEGERLDLPAFEREDDDEYRVMCEVPAGSNRWYQAYFENESLNEIHLRFPGTRKTKEYLEWIDKRSSRISRLGLAPRQWVYIKQSDGAWMPKGSVAKAGTGSDQDSKKKSGKKAKKPRGRSKLGGGSRHGTPASDEGAAVVSGISTEGEKKVKRAKVAKVSHKEPSVATSSGKKESNPPKSSSSDDESDSETSESSSSDDEDTKRQRNEATRGFEALSSWFEQHLKALPLKLRGSVEAGCMNEASLHPPKRRARQPKDSKPQQKAGSKGSGKSKLGEAGGGEITV